MCVRLHADDSAAKEAEKQAAAGSTFRAFDGFDGKLALKWKPVRPDPSHISLTKKPGTLTITTQKGTIHRDEKSDALSGGTQAKNLYVMPNPAPKGGDFVVTTCIDSFAPNTNWQQAGLIVYDDDDNYLRWDLEWNRSAPSGVTHVFLWETNQKSQWAGTPTDPNAKRFWLRITKRGRHYLYAQSIDAKTYTTVGEQVWGNGAPKQIGIFAKNGGNPNANDVDASFDFFEIRSLTTAEKNDPSYVERRNLQGTWKVTSCRAAGRLMENTPISQFVFADDKLMVTEEQHLETEYTLDVTKKPRQLIFSALLGSSGGPVKAVYSLEEDTLVICFDTRPGAPAPGELETTKGDGRLLLKLKRAK